MSDRQSRMQEYLLHATGWVTAKELADHLGVTPRSVRSYMTALKAAAEPLTVLESGPAGYRLNRDAYAEFRTDAATPGDADTPQHRLYRLIRRLTDSTDGLDVYALSADLVVSDATIEADLGRVRALVAGSGLNLVREGSVVTLAGTETDRRKLLSRMFREESARGLLELEVIQREFAASSLGAFKTDLIAALDEQGYFVNEYGTNNVLLHLAIAVDRVTKRTGADSAVPQPVLPQVPSATGPSMPSTLAELITRHFQVTLGASDLDYLALLLQTRVLTPGGSRAMAPKAQHYARADDLAVVRRIVTRASAEYLVDLANEDFIARLTLHVRNLIDRAQMKSYSRNPLTRSIKTSYPMIYELAVYIASELQREEDIVITDDEIAYIAMHVGAHIEQQARRVDLVTCVIVCPNYYDLHRMLRQRVERLLSDDLEVLDVVTRSDVDWADLTADLVLTTIEPGVHRDGTLLIQPFLTEGDVDRIRQAAIRVRRVRRRAQIRDDLLQFFDEALFLRNFYAHDEPEMIRALGQRMIDRGVIDQDYVDGALQRELMSSTAFTDNLAVPHAMSMTARRSSIAIVVNDVAMAWGENRVTVIALIAFSAAGRASFQAVFDQFVEVFAEHADVQRLIRRSTNFSAFIDELVHLMDQ